VLNLWPTTGRTNTIMSHSRHEARETMLAVLDGQWPTDRIANWLRTSSVASVSTDELLGFLDGMMARAIHLQEPRDCLDSGGTGGDRKGTFNVSTAAAVLAAAGGVPVAKVGNRASTSFCGSADVLEAVGVRIDVPPDRVPVWLDECGFVFILSPAYHPALGSLRTLRQSIGVPTFFNLLGPLANPVRPMWQVLGVSSRALMPTCAAVLQAAGTKCALVVHSEDGLDEISVAAPTTVMEVRPDHIAEYVLRPEDFGITPQPLDSMVGSTAHANALSLRRVMNGGAPALASFCCVNAAAAFWVAGRVATFKDGYQLAQALIEGGAAAAKLDELITRSRTELLGTRP
jgi:anthranilate phosphoribosyltransferase